ncbi:MAG: hypothetical protein ABSB59_43725 [Streptosporangiaceae bacterium]
MSPVIAAPVPGQAPPAPAVSDKAGAAAAAPGRHAKAGRDGPGIWLYVAFFGLFALAGAAAAVSFSAQYRLVYAARHLAVAAGLEAAIPDAAALVFACLGVALALHGRRAIRARLLNMAAAGASVFMNVIAAAPGWRDLAVWAMPPAAYALASDTLIGVIRTGVIARQGAGGLAREGALLAAAVGLALWLLRLVVAPRSTLAGFRTWVLEECPVAPGRCLGRPGPARAAVPAGRDGAPRRDRAGVRHPADAPGRGSGPRGGTKTARFLALVAERHGPLAAIPLGSVGRICAGIAPEADLNGGAARAALRRAVLAAQDGGRS